MQAIEISGCIKPGEVSCVDWSRRLRPGDTIFKSTFKPMVGGIAIEAGLPSSDTSPFAAHGEPGEYRVMARIETEQGHTHECELVVRLSGSDELAE